MSQKDYHNSGGLLALLGSLVFVFVFFIYIVYVNKGVDLAENVTEPAKPGEVQFDLASVKEPWIANEQVLAAGAKLYKANCAVCHGANGEGVASLNGIGYTYPPLWGEHSYNNGAGLFRLSRFAGYIKDNMPFKQASHAAPVLTDDEAWDVAAYVNSQPRPYKDLSKDWPDISKKPIDHPFGPYNDGFSEQQHKFGPFKPIEEARKKMNEKK